MSEAIKTRRAVVTGAASGIGAATVKHLKGLGWHVLGVDLKGADIDCDITSADSIANMVQAVSKQFDGALDALVANAGINAPKPVTLDVNYFGTVACIEALLPLLAKGNQPRVSVTASAASLQPYQDEQLIDAMLKGDRTAAHARAEALIAADPKKGYFNYSSSKRAIARWIRRESVSDRFAGAGIALNGIGPGVVITAMTRDLLKTEKGREEVLKHMPCPLNGPAEAEDIAAVHAFLASPAAGHLAGQIIYVDGGYDVETRGDDVFGGGKF